MTLEHHFVVKIDESGEANIDYDTSVNFDAGDVWDNSLETWFNGNDDAVSDSYEKAEKLMLSLVAKTWSR